MPFQINYYLSITNRHMINYLNKKIEVLPTSIGIAVLETDGGSRNASVSRSKAAASDTR